MSTPTKKNTEAQQLIKKYTTVYKIIFQYSFFAIPLILGIILSFFLQSRNVIEQIRINQTFKQSTYVLENGVYTPSRVSDQIGPILNGIGDIKILGGDLQATGEVLIGRNNVIALHDIILPDQQYIIDFSFTGGLQHFEKDYSASDLVWVLNNRILSLPPTAKDKGVSSVINDTFFRDDKSNQETNMEHILQILMERKYFINVDLEALQGQDGQSELFDKYNLKCMLQPKVYDGMCNKNIEYFIQNLPSINLEGKWEEIFTISKKIKKDEHIDGFCANLMYNVFKQPYPSSNLDTLMNGVCSEYNLRYSKIKDFLKVENELMNIVSEDVINNNPNANLFKLVSLWQKIIIQENNKAFDINTINAYLKFLTDLIQQPGTRPPQFYIDGSYYFNNVYLKNIARKQSSTTTNTTTKNDVASVLDKINSLNKGNSSVGIIGLEGLIKNAELLQLTTNRGSIPLGQLSNFDNAFANYLKGYPELIVGNATTDTTTRTARVLGDLKYTLDGKERVETIIATFDFVSTRFILSSVRLPNNAGFDKLLISFMSHNNNLSFGNIIEFIKKNGDYTPTNITICDVLDNQKFDLNSCNGSSAVIGINDQTLTLGIVNNIVISATSNNTTWNEYLQRNINLYGGIGIDSIVSIIEKMIASSETGQPTEDPNVTIAAEKLAIISKFNQFLGTPPTSITKKDNKWVVTFELKGYSFAALVDIPNNYKLSPLVIEVGEEAISIPSFSLPLIPFSQTSISQFINDPLGYIKNIDIAAYQKIITLQEKK